mmetsp:Transcript_26624/g.26509  ORF Transcript_26624/g.26509 Transcript_26624/m.26509 type:complete len:118 (+) Transcript_26624:1351-1704(+)
MLVLAMKVGHQDLDNVCHIKAKVLYKRCKDANIPFSEWHNWIENQLNNLYLKKIYENSSNNSKSLSRSQSREFGGFDSSTVPSSTQSERDELLRYFSSNSNSGELNSEENNKKPNKK